MRRADATTAIGRPRDLRHRRATRSKEGSRMSMPVYTHDSRPEWGRGVVAEELADRTRYVFETGGERILMNEPFRLRELTLADEEREALAKTLLRGRASIARKAIPTGEAQITFERQEQLFVE